MTRLVASRSISGVRTDDPHQSPPHLRQMLILFITIKKGSWTYEVRYENSPTSKI